MASALSIVKSNFPQVTRIIDSKRPVRISVTSNDVKNSKKKDRNGCAMAVACKRKLKLDGVIVSIKRGYLIKGKNAIRFQIPESVSREITSFDRGAEFAPGDYKLDAIPPTQRIGAPRERTPRKRPHKMLPVHHTENIRAILGVEK